MRKERNKLSTVVQPVQLKKKQISSVNQFGEPSIALNNVSKRRNRKLDAISAEKNYIYVSRTQKRTNLKYIICLFAVVKLDISVIPVAACICIL